jgi:hypothetical protein
MDSRDIESNAHERIAHCRKLAAMWSKSAGWMAALNFRRAGDTRSQRETRKADERHIF